MYVLFKMFDQTSLTEHICSLKDRNIAMRTAAC